MSSHNTQIEIKIEKLCRTCLSKDNELNSLFDIVGSVSLDHIVTTITGLKIQKGDGLPTTICCECKDKAERAYDFKKQSHEANNSLRSLFKKEKSVIDPTISNVQCKSNVKTEEELFDEQDDFSDADYIPLSNIPDGGSNLGHNLDNEVVKREKIELEHSSYRQCKKCCIIFDSNTKLQEHKKNKCIKVEFDESVSYCPICGTCYDGANSLTKHMWEHHADLMGTKKRGRPKKILTSTILNKLSENGFFISSTHGKCYQCSFCGNQYQSKDDLCNHMMEHKDTKILCCVYCKRMFLKRKYFNNHVCIEDTKLQKQLNNDTSDMQLKKEKHLSFATEMFLQELMDPNTDTSMNLIQVCSACSGVFLTEGDLINHHDAEHPELSLRCNHCTKVFASVKTAARHRIVCKQVERTHKCTTCGLKFAYEISLNKHILRYHRGQSVSVAFISKKKSMDNCTYQCDTCSKIFQRKESLAKHAKLHMPNQKLFECDVCQRKFNRSDNLRTHKKTHDVDRTKPPQNNCLCLYCGRGFSNSSNLIVHMRRHTGEKPYKCDFCGKGFPRSSDLMVHRRSHTGEKPCVCRICGKAFSRSNKLSRHMRVHTGQRPYKCTYCDKAFSQSNDLTLHIRRHTGDRPYICEICGDRFIQGTALQNHRRVHGHFAAPINEIPSQVAPLTYTVSNITHTSHIIPN